MSTNEKYVLYGGPEPPLIEPTSKSLGETILKKFNEHGDSNVFIDAITDIRWSASELRSRIIQCAKILQQKFGVKEGDAIGVYSENRLEFSVVVFAAFCLGATVAPLNVTYTTRELHHALNLSRPKVLFVTKIVAQKAAEVVPKNRFVQNVVLLDDVGAAAANWKFNLLNDLVRQFPLSECKSFDCKPINIRENVCLIMCSSGTTGMPKGVELTQFNILMAISKFDATLSLVKAAIERVVVLMVIPMFHAYGLLTTIATSVTGSEIVVLPKFEEHSFLNAIQTYKTNLGFLVPPLLLFLAKSPLVDKYDVSSLMIIVCGAAPLSKELELAVKDRLNVFSIRQGYGMSEMTLSVLTQSETHCKAGSVGALRPGAWGKIINLETGKALGPNQRGEMCFKGSDIMKGYTKNPTATRETIDPDGWLHTGDIGYYDDDEEWFIVDRIKELIKYKGFQVPPAEIEAILLTHPNILDAAVIGIPDEKAGELPLAFVVRKKGANLTQGDVCAYVAKTTSPAKRLNGGVRFVDDIPRNPSGKILRRVLREGLNQKSATKSKL